MWQTLKDTLHEWADDKVPRLSAALAFYTMLSLAPLLIISFKIVSLIMRGKGTGQQIENYLADVSSPQAAETFKQILEKGQQPSAGLVATLVSVVILLFSASGVFGELQTSMHEVWEIAPRPNRGIMATIKERFFSMTLVLGVAFLLLVSLIISTVLSTMSKHLMPSQSFFWQSVNFIVSLAIITCLFALIFKYLPDAVVRWKYVWIGAAVTAVLFTIGKWFLAIYLAHGTTASVFGAMGSLVALLIWVYYSSQIFFFGGELIQVYAAQEGHPIRPDETAMHIDNAAGKDQEKPQETWYPAVPARRELAVAPAYAIASADNGGGSGAGSKLLMLAAGVAVGKFLLGTSDKGAKKLAVGTLVEPGFVTRRKHFENKEYVFRFRPPRFVARAADQVQRGYKKVKNRISEYIEK
ncbi:MAG TPA: YihY/virulence factor BrkB family protein [Tepidisphaeraceae bacterium]|jgi:membrane protein|nr:YihY/virulence factor BrkB family protein [Tepidisphaeraceae bacterium]